MKINIWDFLYCKFEGKDLTIYTSYCNLTNGYTITYEVHRFKTYDCEVDFFKELNKLIKKFKLIKYDNDRINIGHLSSTY
jgi:hypothetical protein